ncbi:ABC transporter C family member 10 [Euphorbia peplus]|nr:ABC transporter C family member 10 [Euphorbia peplus]
MKICSVFTFLFAGFLCLSSLLVTVIDRTVSIMLILNSLTLPGAVLLLFFCFKRRITTDITPSIDNHGFYAPLPCEKANATGELNLDENVTPFSTAGVFSKMAFWWLNPLMKKGKDKILEDEDIPKLRQEDRAKVCYLAYMEEVRKQKHKVSSDSISMLPVIISLHWKQILISGFFALIKVLTVSSGPLFLKALIEVAQEEGILDYEGYALAVGLFVAKVLESLSERQWYFRTRLVGVQVRSMLSAAIYQKQLHLSNVAKAAHSPGEIVNYVASDAYRIGEFPYWFHQIWTTSIQLCLSLAIIYYTVGLATIAAFIAIVLTVLGSSPLIKTQLKYQRNLMEKQDERLKAIAEALANMKVLKLYAWQTHFKNLTTGLREAELYCISKLLLQKAYNLVLFWSCPVLIPAVTFWACYFLNISLSASSVFTFLATLRIAQEPVRFIPEVLGIFIEAKVSLDRIQSFLEEPELKERNVLQNCSSEELKEFIFIRSSEIFWDADPSTKPTLRNINLVIQEGNKVAVCGEVGSGKSTLLASVLGEVPKINGIAHVHGRIAYVPQVAWIQTGTIQENILFGSELDQVRYHEVVERCSLVKDLEMLPYGDLTQIGEKGVNLSGGQKQRIQLARALYQDADVYLLDDPFSAVDAHTATFLFNEYVIGALSEKTVLLVTHQVDFLPAFSSILLMSGGEIIREASYDELMASSQEFQDLVNAHKNTAGYSERKTDHAYGKITEAYKGEIQTTYIQEQLGEPMMDQLIKEEEREAGNTGFKPYLQYLRHGKGFLHFSLGTIFHVLFLIGLLIQNYWLAANIQNFDVSRVLLFTVYTGTGLIVALFLLLRSLCIVLLGFGASRSIFSSLSCSLFYAPMSFYDSTPLGRILSRVSSDLSIIDTEVAYRMLIASGSTISSYSNFLVLAFLTWPVLFVIVPMLYISSRLQAYYYASTKELMRINGTNKSSAASQLAESITGAMVIRAFRQEDQFFLKNLDLIDRNASSYFHSFSANEWLIERLEILCAIVLSSTALAMTSLKLGASASGFIGMELSYGLSLNLFLVGSIQNQCMLSNLIVSVERVEQYMTIPSEAPEVIEGNRPDPNWPAVGKVEICNLKVRYRSTAPLVLHGISCTIEGGQKVGIVGRTGSGKTTLISALFRLVEPAEGKIVIDGIDISTIGLHDLRSHLAIIPQDPTLFVGSVRYNLDPLSEYTDQAIWQVVEKCHLRAAVQGKEDGLNSPVNQDGSNWSMGQRQLFCLGRALLKRSKILVLDEATASVDNWTDSVIQKTIRTEFAGCTIITVAHRIPTVMDCNMVLAISDGKLAEYDEPLKLMSKDGSIFAQLVKEYWSHTR